MVQINVSQQQTQQQAKIFEYSQYGKSIYLDNAATTKPAPEVIETMLDALKNNPANASSLHKSGVKAKIALETARNILAQFINAEPSEIFFTSGATESINTIIKQVAFTFGNTNKKDISNNPKTNKDSTNNKNHIITSAVEHHSVLNTCKFLEEDGIDVTFLQVDKFGRVNPSDVKTAIEEKENKKVKTILVSIMHANNEIGTIQQIEEISKICKQKNVLFHTDAVQIFGKLPIDVKRINIDFLSASAHKLHGPKGVGLLYINNGITNKTEGIKLVPFMHGGTQENNFRPGTENIPAIIGFAKAVELSVANMEDDARLLRGLWDKLIKQVLGKIPDSSLNGHPTERLPNNVHFSFKFVEGEAILKYLDEHGIEVSTGSACTSRNLLPSHVLTAIGLKAHELHGSIRITMSRYTTEEEVEYCALMLEEAVKKLRKI